MAFLQQRTPAWHAARKGKLTASNVGAALGLCPWTSRQQAFNRAMGLERFLGAQFNAAIGHVPLSQLSPRPLFAAGNDATRWGTANEANGILAYTAHTGNVVDNTGLHVCKNTTWLAGSPDGLIGTEGLLEVKCPFWRKKDGSRLHKDIPSYYYMQMNLCLECTERKWCDFISWAPEGYVIYRVWRDKELHEALLPFYLKFFAAMQRIAKGPPPLSSEEEEQIKELVAESQAKYIDKELWSRADLEDSPPECEDEQSGPPCKKRKTSDEEAEDPCQ